MQVLRISQMNEFAKIRIDSLSGGVEIVYKNRTDNILGFPVGALAEVRSEEKRPRGVVRSGAYGTYLEGGVGHVERRVLGRPGQLVVDGGDPLVGVAHTVTSHDRVRRLGFVPRGPPHVEPLSLHPEPELGVVSADDLLAAEGPQYPGVLLERDGLGFGQVAVGLYHPGLVGGQHVVLVVGPLPLHVVVLLGALGRRRRGRLALRRLLALLLGHLASHSAFRQHGGGHRRWRLRCAHRPSWRDFRRNYALVSSSVVRRVHCRPTLAAAVIRSGRRAIPYWCASVKHRRGRGTLRRHPHHRRHRPVRGSQ
jgi:hypothetical protein